MFTDAQIKKIEDDFAKSGPVYLTSKGGIYVEILRFFKLGIAWKEQGPGLPFTMVVR